MDTFHFSRRYDFTVRYHTSYLPEKSSQINSSRRSEPSTLLLCRCCPLRCIPFVWQSVNKILPFTMSTSGLAPRVGTGMSIRSSAGMPPGSSSGRPAASNLSCNKCSKPLATTCFLCSCDCIFCEGEYPIFIHLFPTLRALANANNSASFFSSIALSRCFSRMHLFAL